MSQSGGGYAVARAAFELCYDSWGKMEAVGIREQNETFSYAFLRAMQKSELQFPTIVVLSTRAQAKDAMSRRVK